MPGFDGTGPNGQGPKTGRGEGNCDNGSTDTGFSRPRRGLGRRGRGLGPRGRGMARRNGAK